jgi:hypothetical protein
MAQALRPRFGRQHGLAAVEFALTAIVLFSFLFGVIEMARLAFLWNSLSHATDTAARGLAMTSLGSGGADARATVLQHAIFVNSAAVPMPLSGDIKYNNLVYDYLDADGSPIATSDLPTCQVANVMNCLADPNAKNCVHYVRVRLCKRGTNCTQVQYQPIVPLPAFAGLNIPMPYFTAMAPLEAQALPGDCN